LQILLLYFLLFSSSTTDNKVFVVFGEDFVLDLVVERIFFSGGIKSRKFHSFPIFLEIDLMAGVMRSIGYCQLAIVDLRFGGISL